ncbi:hypothetical protein [Clostridium perfringens]|uniref:hypothetical protein n=1 Tax=Clostridium perfringens TaxID=1502 RepID=UPI0023DD763B|nr:hypothetical protein [Clostridium perfringens]
MKINKRKFYYEIENNKIDYSLVVENLKNSNTSFSYVLLRLIRFCFFLPAAPTEMERNKPKKFFIHANSKHSVSLIKDFKIRRPIYV